MLVVYAFGEDISNGYAKTSAHFFPQLCLCVGVNSVRACVRIGPHFNHPA